MAIKSKLKKKALKTLNVIIEYGSPKNIITRELSNVVDADLIICGATGFNAVERFLIGSVSEAIVRSAKCDVLLSVHQSDFNSFKLKTLY